MMIIHVIIYALVLLWPCYSTSSGWCVLGAGEGQPPILRRVQVTLKGEVFYVSDVTTVAELQQRLWEESGWDESEQGRVTFQGQVLEPDDLLSRVGVKDGNQINMVPKSMADHWKMVQEMGKGLVQLQSKISSFHSRFGLPGGIGDNDKDSDSSSSTTTTTTNARRDLQDFQILSELYQDMIKVPYMHNEMERFSEQLQRCSSGDDDDEQDSSLSRYSDPERIESLRQVILNNPMLLAHLLQSSPTVKAALEDSTAWFQMIQAAVARWKTMDGYQLWQHLVDGTLFEE